MEKSLRNANNLDGSLDNCSRYNPSIDSHYFYPKDMFRNIILSSLPHYFADYSKAFDKIKRALHISVVFILMFSCLHFLKMYVQEYDKLVTALIASTLNV